mmetsp:Transcript_102512/g.330794  ORF Transcript_102512/g.330794 Transcript_102512/m.330794 type:complete len:214 (-) Transcript_102512:685-1326(-)
MKEPGRSGMRTAMRDSEVSARSETKRSRSKSMFAPLVTATSVLPVMPVFSTYLFNPATASAPAGSNTTRVSMNESLMAAQMSSVDTVIISSTTIWQSRKVSSPTRRTAAPSAKRPTEGSSRTSPASRLCVMAAESEASTPTTLIEGFTDFRKMPMPERRPPPPTQQKTVSTVSLVVCARISWPMVPWPAITRGSLKGCTSTRPSASTHAMVAA